MDGSILDVDLFTPSSTGSISNMILWDGDFAIEGMFSTINYLNSTGWSNLSVVKSGDGQDILFSGDYAAASVPEPGTWLLLGTGVLVCFGILRRRRIK